VILGHEFSGVVAAIGPACTGVQVGDAVFGLNDWFTDGAQAEYCLTVPVNVAPKPASLKHTQAAVVPISALTAWQGLIDRAQLSEGQRVLIHGAAGGVGSFAVQLAHHKKAHVIATVSATNADFVKSLGADEVIDYKTTPFEKVVKDVDVVFDTVGGDTRDRSWGVLRKGGQLVTIAADPDRLSQPRVRDAFFIVEPNKSQLIEISRLIDTGVIKPVVGSIFLMKEFREAYERKPARGKNVLHIAEARVTRDDTSEKGRIQ
jgi:NADPH:quinone reductase-like Zn-dependent oxidoreductase